jgi:hypothetical protein
LCKLSAERIWLDEIRERPFSVDLHNRQPLAIASLEPRVSTDVDLLELERHFGSHRLDRALRSCAEVAAFGVVEDDPGYGYRPRVMVASETRWTARP